MDFSKAQINHAVPELETLLPIGMLSDATPGAKAALEAIRALETVIRKGAQANARYARYALLQEFPRSTKNKADEGLVTNYATALMPEHVFATIRGYNELEKEAFLKLYLVAHETWGHLEAIGFAVKAMLETAAHCRVPVRVGTLEKQDRAIPNQFQSVLGEHLAEVGVTFALGKRMYVRPEHYDIIIGPVSRVVLGWFESAQWAVRTSPSEKLQELVSLVEPYFLSGRLKILVETRGCVLGSAVMGKETLGKVQV